MIAIQNVTKTFGNKPVLENIDMIIEEGSIHGIIGENGVGKTTLLQMMAGIYTVEEGTILIDDEAPYENGHVKEKIAYIADRNQFFHWYKVKDMVDFFEMSYPSFSREKFETFNVFFEIPMKKKISQLSKGMQMRLNIMLGFAIQAKYMLLDEPTSGLDALAKNQFYKMLVEAAEDGTTIVISSHHLNDVEKICDKVTMLSATRIQWEKSMSDLKDKIKKLQVVFTQAAPVDISTWTELIDVQQIGSIYYLVTNQYDQAFEAKLQGCGTTLVEELPLTLEEIFIYTSQKKGAVNSHA